MQHQLVRAGVEAVVQWARLEGAPMMARLSESKDRAFASMQAVFSSLQKADMKAKLGNGRRERELSGMFRAVGKIDWEVPLWSTVR